MPRYQPLDSNQHAGHGWRRCNSLAHAAGALLLAAAQLLSGPRVSLLQTLAKRRSALNSVAELESIEERFGSKDDTLQFHF